MVTCGHCGCENNNSETTCIKCGHVLNVESELVICSVCGLTNKATNTLCESCMEKLDLSKKYCITNAEEAEASPDDWHASDLVDTKVKKGKNIINYKKVMSIMILMFLIVTLAFLAVRSISHVKKYITSDEGFYYITGSRELHVVTKAGHDYPLLREASDDLKVHLYGNQGFVLNGEDLYGFDGPDVYKIATQVRSYKINLSGDQILYTSSLASTGKGELFLFEGKNSKSIAKNVEKDRYCFGKASDLYYVGDVQAPDILGTLYLSQGKRRVEMTSDVYMPVFSNRKGTVYFTKDNLNEGETFDLYYTNAKIVKEISQSVQHILLTPDVEAVCIVQKSNDKLTLINNKREKSEPIATNILQVGIYNFDDRLKKLQYLDSKSRPIFLKISDNSVASTNLATGKLSNSSLTFSAFNCSKVGQNIYYLSGTDLYKGILRRGLVDESLSIKSHVDLVSLSKTGNTLVMKDKENLNYVYDEHHTITLDDQVQHIQISDDDKYIVYVKANNDLCALKIGANDEILIDKNVKKMVVLDEGVYSLSEGFLNHYKLGKYASKKRINNVIKIGSFD